MNQMPYFEFKNTKYGIGTIVKIPYLRRGNLVSQNNPTQIATFVGGGNFQLSSCYGFICLNIEELDDKYRKYVEIIKPIYYQEPESPTPQNIFVKTKSGSWDAYNDVCIGLIWYIIIMLVGIIFKDRLTIWICATVVFFIWKSKK